MKIIDRPLISVSYNLGSTFGTVIALDIDKHTLDQVIFKFTLDNLM